MNVICHSISQQTLRPPHLALGRVPCRAAPFVSSFTFNLQHTGPPDGIRTDVLSRMHIDSISAVMNPRVHGSVHFISVAHLELRFPTTKCAPGRTVCWASASRSSSSGMWPSPSIATRCLHLKVAYHLRVRRGSRCACDLASPIFLVPHRTSGRALSRTSRTSRSYSAKTTIAASYSRHVARDARLEAA